jgi:dipeptidase
LLVAICAVVFVVPGAAAGCFTVVVGKDASADGYVIMAHNEDDGPPQIVNHSKVPRRTHLPGERVRLLNGGELAQVAETWAYIWSQMPGLRFSDSYLNEWGVCIASDACPSREDRPELTDGGISYMLRRLVAERARTAREGVDLAGELVERFGYDSSGRTYTICDPEEGWFFCAVNGKHWLAWRVPDGEVAVVANTFTVHDIDLEDPDHCLASADIIGYAASRGWYDPAGDGTLDFAAVYADSAAAADSSNFCRQWGGLRLICAEPIPLGPRLPTSVVPRQKMDVPAVMQVLRDHYEGTDLRGSSAEGRSPHEGSLATICNSATQTSFVVQLRRGMPLDVGVVYWVCLSSPCTSFYIPFHLGIAGFPPGYAAGSGRPSENDWRERITRPFVADRLQAFWTFSSFHHRVHYLGPTAVAEARVEMQELQLRALAAQEPVEEAACRLYPADAPAARRALVEHSTALYLSALEAMERVLSGQ